MTLINEGALVNGVSPLQANGNANSSGSDLGSLDSAMQQQTPLNVKAGALSEKLSKRFDSLGAGASPDTIKKRGLRVCCAWPPNPNQSQFSSPSRQTVSARRAPHPCRHWWHTGWLEEISVYHCDLLLCPLRIVLRRAHQGRKHAGRSLP